MSSVEVDRSGELRQSDDHHGWPVLDGTGRRVGTVDALFEDAGGRPRLLGMRAGPLGGSHTLLPLELVQVAHDEQEIRTRWTPDRIRSAPRYDDGEPLGADLQRAAHEHFGREPSAAGAGEAEMVRSEEELHLRTHRRSYGGARLHKTVELEDVERQVPIHADFVQMHEIDVPDPDADSGRVERLENGDVSVPVFEERLVVHKELIVTKRVLLARERRVVGEQTVSDVLRRERIELEVDRRPEDVEREAGALAGEDLSLGPTPRTRHPEGGRDDVRDTTQGPTPETRKAMRLSKAEDDEAAGEPASDRTTRSPGGGTQDRGATPSDTERRALAPDPQADLVRVDDPDRRLHDSEADGPAPSTTKER
jgi:uncharacterized protein (TIGR02271 family)